ncbi:MAG: hypothetical protein ABSG81_12555 [Acidimicrobiales bacterium]
MSGAGRALSPRSTALARGPLSLPALVLACLAGLGFFVAVVAVRGGPSVGDAYGVTTPATAIADGDLTAAAHDQVLPQPAGYALLASPFIVVLRPVIGTPTWCDARVAPVTRLFLKWCAADQLSSHRWYRSQAVLGLLAWLVLAIGAVRLLRAAGGGGPIELLLVLMLAAIPAASDGIVETFHPQDLVCVGLTCAALGETLRRRWVLTGVLFGAAFLCKQFALLPLIAVVVAAPTMRARLLVVGVAAGVVGCGIAPFAVADPRATWNTLSAVNPGSVIKLTTGTVVGMTGLTESTKLHIARDGPVVLALAMSLWARRRAGSGLLTPLGLIGLATACLAARLVAEVWFASYYLLAVSAALLVLDLAAKRVPVWSCAWIAGTGVLVEQAGGIPDTTLGAVLAFISALAALFIGLRAVPRRDPVTAPSLAGADGV